jgi:hypothetical protein
VSRWLAVTGEPSPSGQKEAGGEVGAQRVWVDDG